MKISAKVLADFMLASSVRRKSILRDAKFKVLKDGSPKPQIVRYREAGTAFRHFHKSGNNLAVLQQVIERLEDKKSKLAPEKDSSRLDDNIRAIKDYAKHFSGRKFTILKTPKPAYFSGAAQVSAAPDMYVEEEGVKKLVKLDCKRKESGQYTIDIILKIIHEAASPHKLVDAPSNVICLTVSSGVEHNGEKLDRGLKRSIDEALATIEEMWPSIRREE